MQKLIPIDLTGVIEEVKAEGKSRRVLWQDSESIAFLSSGRKERWDFHIDPADEVTLQLTGVQHLVYRDEAGKEHASVEPESRITFDGSVISAARKFTKLPSRSAITVPILWGRSTKSSPAMKKCAPAKIAARWFPCRRSSGNELVPIVQTVSEPESEYLPQRTQRARRRNLVSELGALGARKILSFVYFVSFVVRPDS